MGLLVAAVAALVAPVVAATAAGPAVVLDRTQLQPGQRVEVTLAGWRSSRVNLSVCGNLARRGSADCNVAASQEVGLANGSNVTVSQLVVFAPPNTCPCVVRAASQSQDEVVLTPIELIGVPIGPLVGPDSQDPVAVSVEVQEADRGLAGALRATLGGPASYQLRVSVRNDSARSISNLSLEGAAGRGGSDTAVSFDLPSPGTIEPGQTWAHQRTVTLPSLMFAGASWRVTATGAGAVEAATTVTHHAPIGLFVLAAALILDIIAMTWRMVGGRVRRPRRRSCFAPASARAHRSGPSPDRSSPGFASP